MTQNNLFGDDLPHVIRGEMNLIEKEWVMPTSFPDLSSYKQIALDLETKDPRIKELGPGWSRKDGHIIGIALAAGDESWYFPIRHANGHNLDARMTMKWLKKQLSDPHKDVIMHNATYDAGWLRAEGVEIAGRIIDTMITGALVDENRWSFGLDAMARDYAEIRKDEKLLQAAAKEWGIDPKADMWQLPPKYVGLYAEQDAVATLKLWEALKIELERQDLWSIWNIENGLIPCLLDMRSQGVRVDLEKAEVNKKLIRKRANEQRKILRDAAGFDVDIWAANSIAKMFDKLEIAYPTTDQGAPSFTKQFLNACEDPVARALVRLRELDKADSTFIESILKHAHNGRIHTELHSTRRDEGGTVTGRFCVAADTLIETQRGPVPIVDIKPRKDLALTHRGRLQTIRHLIYKGEEEMVALRVSSGNVIKCTRNHRVLTESGWVSVGDLTVGQEISGVDIKEGLVGRGPLPQSGGAVLGTEQANDQGCGVSVVRQLSHGAGDVEARNPKGSAQEGAGAEVLSFEDWSKKPDDKQEGVAASQLQGPLVLRSGGVRADCEAGLVHGTGWFEAHLRAQRGHGGDAWFDGSAERHGSSPHRRGPDEQQSGQLGSGHSNRAQSFACSVTVEEIESLGVAPVWDIEVETDHSYVAHGLIHHNSSSNPNLQQIPARDPEIKKLIRGLFIPEEGCRWGSFDYSSQEPRLLVHFAASMPENLQHPIVGEIVEAYNTSDVDLHQMVADIAGISRKEAKTVNLGIMYGMGVAKLANQLSISDTEAKILLGTHHERVPFVRQLAETATRQAERNGQIRTLLGRLCRFDMWEPSTFGYNKPLPFEEAQKKYGGMGRLRRAFTYKALNRLIQGSAADQTKKAMLDCYREGLTPMLTVHDELCFSVESDEQAARIKEIMETGCPLKVPSKIDQALEADWGDVE